MLRRSSTSLAMALLGGLALVVLWWPMLAILALMIEGPSFFAANRLVAFLGTAKGAVFVSLLPALGLIHGAIIGAVRGKWSGLVAIETLGAPFAWIVTAGEGMIGGVIMVVSLLPGACLGTMLGLWLAGTPTESKTWPDEAATGAILGVGISLLLLNLFVQWPSLTGKASGGRKPP